MNIPWDRIGNVAQITVALIALGTLAYTVRQNAKTAGNTAEQNAKIAKFLAHASDAFVAQSYPTVKFYEYYWFETPEGLDCSNPAIGIGVYYRNFSGVPVAIEEASLKVKMGNAPILPGPAEVEEKPPGEVLLPPGTRVSIGLTGPSIKESYKRLQGQHGPPNLNFELGVTFRSLISGKRYLYTGKVTIHDDCHFPKQYRAGIGPETMVEIPAR
jgi:hypothetical protein